MAKYNNFDMINIITAKAFDMIPTEGQQISLSFVRIRDTTRLNYYSETTE